MNPEISLSCNSLPTNYKGVIVAYVSPDSPADKAGLKGLDTQDDSSTTLLQPSLQTADIITAIDGHSVWQIDDIINYIESQKNVGYNIKLTVNRDGQIMDLPATLQARPNAILQTSLQQQQDQQQPEMLIIPELPHNQGHRHHLPRFLQPLP